MQDPLLKEIEMLKKHLLKTKQELKQVKSINCKLKRENKKQYDLLVKIQGQVMRELNRE